MTERIQLGLTDVSASATPAAPASAVTEELLVTGMTCGHCAASVREELSEIDGVEAVTVDLVAGGTSHVTVHSATGDGEATVIGSDNHILAYSHIAHNVLLGNHVILSNNGTLAGHVIVEDHAVVGGLSAVHQFCRLGKISILGGCTKVVSDVAPFMMVDGNPARTRAVNKVGLERNGVTAEAQEALRRAHRLYFRKGLTGANAVEAIRAEVPQLPEVEHFLTFVETSDRGITR